MNLCPWCGIRIVSGETCVSHRSVEAQAAIPPSDKHAAPGRAWRDNRGITRWVIDEPDPGRACLTCDAKPWERCITSTGQDIKPHAGRRIARTCKCGKKLRKPKGSMCQKCADESTAVVQARHKAQRRKAA